MSAARSLAIVGGVDEHLPLAQSGPRPRFSAAALACVGVLRSGANGCPAVLVGPRTVLTSATGLRGVSDLTFSVISAHGRELTVRATHVSTHPRYVPTDPFSVDLALVTLESALPGPYAVPYRGPMTAGAGAVGLGLDDSGTRGSSRAVGEVGLDFSGEVPSLLFTPRGLRDWGSRSRGLTAFVAAPDALPCLWPGGGPILAYHPAYGPQLVGIASVLFADKSDDSDVEVWCVSAASQASWIEAHALLSLAPSPERFVRMVLADVLERGNGPAFIGGSAPYLTYSAPRLELATRVLAAPDRRRSELVGWFEHLLGRAPTLTEETLHLRARDRGLNEEGALVSLLSSSEYMERAQALPGSSAHVRFAAALHRDLFGRDVAPGEVDGWVHAMGCGMHRSEVAEALVGSDEMRATLVRLWHRTFLRTDPDAATVGRWLNSMRLGASYEQTKARMLASDEYFNLVV